MANFDRLAELGKPIFLRHDQTALLRKYRLEADAGAIYVRYCGERYAIDRLTANVTASDGTAAGPAVTLTVFDMLCHTEQAFAPVGEWRTTNMLPGCGQSNPDDTLLNRRLTARFEENTEAIREACRRLGGKPFPVGDVAWELPVFDWFSVVFQFWLGDEEFPSAVRFLWDKSTLQYLHYETLYYIMGHILQTLDSMI
ncbi:MAG: DUF3786 domain-containing protein [Oscillospiraceae bacterium]|nr:DUF3786 domain-containing protein [Oscillospiraceae bacterium]